jgi:hypothetical protein
MLKKTLLGTLLSLSPLATAQISLDLNLTVRNQTAQRDTSGTVVIDESTPISVIFNEFETLVFDLLTSQTGEEVTVQVQISQKTESDELVAVTDPLAVRVPFGQPATITVNEESADTENNGSLVLIITPTLVE